MRLRSLSGFRLDVCNLHTRSSLSVFEFLKKENVRIQEGSTQPNAHFSKAISLQKPSNLRPSPYSDHDDCIQIGETSATTNGTQYFTNFVRQTTPTASQDSTQYSGCEWQKASSVEQCNHEARRIASWWHNQYPDSIPNKTASGWLSGSLDEDQPINTTQSMKPYDEKPLDEVEYDGLTLAPRPQGASRKSISLGDPSTLFNDNTDDVEAYRIMESITQEDVECTPLLEQPFTDFIEIHVSGGTGGWSKRGSYRSGKGTGPGYGGDGAHVVLEASAHVDSLVQIRPRVFGKDGGNAWGSHRGANAFPTIIRVPLGTIVRQRTRLPASSASSKHPGKPYQYMFWYQFLTPGEQLLVAQGGRGSIGRSPDQKHGAIKPEQGEKKRLQLELRLMNDCALIGFPNAGKSSVAASITRAYSHIGPEEFSTGRPHLSTIHYRDGLSLTLCDLPALFCGAHQDSKKGRRILRHLYRSKVLIYVLDTASDGQDQRDLLTEFHALRREVRRYSPVHTYKREMIVGTKCDMLHRHSLFNLDSLYFRLKATHPDIPIVGVSARFGLGLDRLVTTIRQQVYPDLLERTSRMHVQPIENVLHPSQEDKQRILQQLDLDMLPPVTHPSPTSQYGSPTSPPVTKIHPSYISTPMPVSNVLPIAS